MIWKIFLENHNVTGLLTISQDIERGQVFTLSGAIITWKIIGFTVIKNNV
jgi:hypothetical protein